jgi:hypothetical protein
MIPSLRVIPFRVRDPHRLAAGRAGDRVGKLAVDDGDLGLEFEALRRLDHVDRRRFGLCDIPEGVAVDEGDMRVVERVLHQPQSGAVPDLVELVDAPEARKIRLLERRDIGQRLAETHPYMVVADLGAEARHLEVHLARRILGLRHLDAGAGRIIRPAVVAADDRTLVEKPARQLGGAVTAAVRQGRRLASLVEPHHDVLAQQTERLRAVLEQGDRHDGVPEPPQHRLASDEHGRKLLEVRDLFPPSQQFPCQPHGISIAFMTA